MLWSPVHSKSMSSFRHEDQMILLDPTTTKTLITRSASSGFSNGRVILIVAIYSIYIYT